MKQEAPRERRDLTTEKQNPNSLEIDRLSIPEILETINREDRTVAEKVQAVLPEVGETVELTVEAIRSGHRVFYVGAGTSGRLGVLDASECPPTFSAPRDWFQGVIAGGQEALTRSIEGAEDKPEDAVTDLKRIGIQAEDVLVGIASSSATPYVVSALEYGKSVGTRTVYLICNPKPLVQVDVDVLIAVDVGPEIITGSTRMKSGTATKLILNMISTATMVRLGKVYGNLMVDLMAVNQKLVDRGTRIIEQLTGLDYPAANQALIDAEYSVKTAIVMVRKDSDLQDAHKLIEAHGGFLRDIIER